MNMCWFGMETNIKRTSWTNFLVQEEWGMNKVTEKESLLSEGKKGRYHDIEKLSHLNWHNVNAPCWWENFCTTLEAIDCCISEPLGHPYVIIQIKNSFSLAGPRNLTQLQLTSEAQQSLLFCLSGSDSKESAFNAGDPGLIPMSWRSHGEGHGNPL